MKNLFQPTWASLALVIGLIATTWTLSSIGYYQLADFLGKPGGYNEGPRIFSIYYGIWCMIAFAIFHPALSAWAKQSSPPEDRFATIFMVTACALFAFIVLPFLPEADIPTEDEVNEIIIAQPWYFLPKSVEILFSADSDGNAGRRTCGPKPASGADRVSYSDPVWRVPPDVGIGRCQSILCPEVHNCRDAIRCNHALSNAENAKRICILVFASLGLVCARHHDLAVSVPNDLKELVLWRSSANVGQAGFGSVGFQSLCGKGNGQLDPCAAARTVIK